MPVEKFAGSKVIGATINKTGSFKLMATKVGKDTTLAQIINSLKKRRGVKPAFRNWLIKYPRILCR